MTPRARKISAVVGDAVLVDDGEADALLLLGERGLIASWPRTPQTHAVTRRAALASPPRLAVVDRAGALLLVDAKSGEVERALVTHGASEVLGFAPSGTRLLARVFGRLAVVDEHGGVGIVKRPPTATTTMVGDRVAQHRVHAPGAPSAEREGAGGDTALFSADGRRALVWTSIGARRSWATVVDVENARVIAFLGEATWAAAIDADCRRAALVCSAGVDDTDLVEWRVDEQIATTLLHGRAGVRAPIRAAYASRRLSVVAAHDAAGVFHTLRATSASTRRSDALGAAPQWLRHSFHAGSAIHVDTERDLLVVERPVPKLTDLNGLHPRALPGDVRTCFAGGADDVDAAFLAGGLLHAVIDGAARVVEGPTDLVDIATHPRGVIGLDRNDRSHVFALADDAWTDDL